MFQMIEHYQKNPDEPWVDTPLGPCELLPVLHSTDILVVLNGKAIGHIETDASGTVLLSELWDDETPQQRLLRQIQYPE